MRIQIYIISILASLIAWGLIVDGSRDAYRSAWSAGVIPNFKIHHRMHHLIRAELGRFRIIGA
jgi:hypothetical protein